MFEKNNKASELKDKHSRKKLRADNSLNPSQDTMVCVSNQPVAATKGKEVTLTYTGNKPNELIQLAGTHCLRERITYYASVEPIMRAKGDSNH